MHRCLLVNEVLSIIFEYFRVDTGSLTLASLARTCHAFAGALSCVTLHEVDKNVFLILRTRTRCTMEGVLHTSAFDRMYAFRSVDSGDEQ
jgi:hypothetical protein